ncbi:MAG TPA: DUF3465 domain-containing protein [Chitinispirillaceae bacterium]|nr:DUF3465 domain-containing protein [Chitinispirillaceae bacterium]
MQLRRHLPVHIATWFTIMLLMLSTSCSLPQSDTTLILPSEQSSSSLDSLLTPTVSMTTHFNNKDSGIVVTVKGNVTRLLSNDTIGDWHQRFIIRMSNAQTLLIAHNIDIAPPVSDVSLNSLVYVHGEYVWNSEGGLVHWTHHDPELKHENGWIWFNNKRYQ